MKEETGVSEKNRICGLKWVWYLHMCRFKHETVNLRLFAFILFQVETEFVEVLAFRLENCLLLSNSPAFEDIIVLDMWIVFPVIASLLILHSEKFIGTSYTKS